jgi:ABC-type multidrug transport system ATPase subunit
VLLYTHIVDDIVQTCPHVIVVDHGTVAYHDRTESLASKAKGAVWIVERPAGHPAPDLPVVAVTPAPASTTYRVISVRQPDVDARPASPTVEDGYVALMHATRSMTPAGCNVRA